MSHVYQMFHGVGFDFHEDRLIDGMAVLWHLTKPSGSPPNPRDNTIVSFSTLWIYEVERFGGCGILTIPFEDWLPTRSDAHVFIAILDQGIGLLRRLGSTIPLDLIQALVSEPNRYSRDPPVEPYVNTIIKLRELIAAGSQNMPIDHIV